MYLSRLTLVDRATEQPELWKSFSGPYAVHQAVWRLFPHAAGAPRDFLYRVETVDGRPQVFTLSPKPPQESLIWRRETKELEPKLAAGDRLEIEVRVNPVVCRQKKRHDVVMDLKRSSKWKYQPEGERAGENELVQQAMSKWLAARASSAGLRVERVLAEGYRQERFSRPGQNAATKIELSLCDLQVVAQVVDPSAFLAVWRTGFGPAKGFGCGLMLLRRARS